MRNAALVLGIIGGLIAMVVGLVGYSWTEYVDPDSGFTEGWWMFDNPALIRLTSFLAPLLAIAGGAMAKVRALWGGVLLLVSGALMYHAYGINPATMFPIGFTILGGLLALAAGKPDEPKAHF